MKDAYRRFGPSAFLALALCLGAASGASCQENPYPSVSKEWVASLSLPSTFRLLKADVDCLDKVDRKDVVPEFSERLAAFKKAIADAETAAKDLSTPKSKAEALKKTETLKAMIAPLSQAAEQAFDYHNMRGDEYLWDIIPEVKTYTDHVLERLKAA